MEHQTEVDKLKDKTKRRKVTNSMAKHMANHHDGSETTSSAKVIGKHRKCLNRLIDESLRIEEGEKRTGLANSKSEWGAGALVKTQITNKRQRNQLSQHEAEVT